MSGLSDEDKIMTQQLDFARQLLTESDAKVADIALASGFGSVRRFNEAFKACYQKTPASCRSRAAPVPAAGLTLRLPIRLPYDWDHVLSYLHRHEAYGIERVADGSYTRFVPRGETFGTVTVTAPPKKPYLAVTLVGFELNEIRPILNKLKVLFDTAHDPRQLPQSARLNGRGIRVPASFEPFATAVTILLGQLVSTEQAKARLKKVIERYGRRLSPSASSSTLGPVYAFPTPAELAAAPVQEIGLTRVLADAIRSVAQAVADGSLDFAASGDFGLEYKKLIAIRGIGPWDCSDDLHALPR